MAMSKAWELVRGIPTVIDVVGNTVTFDIGGVNFPATPGSQGQILKITDASSSPASCGWGLRSTPRRALPLAPSALVPGPMRTNFSEQH